MEKRHAALQLEAYLPAPELVNAVNLALYLRRPLLLMGDPGCGKTRLAEAVAYELHKEKMPAHFFRWDIKSTTKAQEGIYRINLIQRLYDANLRRANVDLDIRNYLSYGELARAFTEPQHGDAPNVLLIDEIDKADIDFPNDLLLELDRREFTIPELGAAGRIPAKSNVVIFITSNREKELPPAFLRRCLYHYIEFPGEAELKRIVSSRFGDAESDEIVGKAVETFVKVREEAMSDSLKVASTSELLDWYSMINHCKMLKAAKTPLAPSEQQLVDQLDAWLRSGRLPFRQVLLKTYESFVQENP